MRIPQVALYRELWSLFSSPAVTHIGLFLADGSAATAQQKITTYAMWSEQIKGEND